MACFLAKGGVAVYVFAAWLVRAFYAVCALLPLREKVTFFSRQGKEKSLDFCLLEASLRTCLPDVSIRFCTTDSEITDKKKFILSFPGMIFHAATSRVCILDGYTPAVSIPSLRNGTVVIQMWHALGAIKKFGYQSVGARDGRAPEIAETLAMHRNYDWVIAGGRGTCRAYAEAFGCDESRVVPLGMPRIDYLLEVSPDSPRMRKIAALKESHEVFSRNAPRVLYAPTLRKDGTCGGWARKEAEKLAAALDPYGYSLVVAGHPLDCGDRANCEAFSGAEFVPGKSMDLAGLCDCVVTDYSAVAFEAALLGKPVFFYVPDIDDYRVSTGLNIDPMRDFPEISSEDPQAIAEKIAEYLSLEGGTLPNNEFVLFSQQYFAGLGGHCAEDISSFIGECYCSTFMTTKG